jgi:hypothetical protein
MAELCAQPQEKNEHFESAQVVLKLKETQEHKRTPTCAKVAISRDVLSSLTRLLVQPRMSAPFIRY